jgi:hypothetical protein
MHAMNLATRALLACLLALFAHLALAAGNTVDKFALVIGNQAYASQARSLSNPRSDAALMARSLRQLGFAVTERSDLTRSQMLEEVAAFSGRLTEGSTALVYFAGHGMQISGANYLVPVDMVPTSEQSVPLKTYPLDTLLERLSAAKSAVNLVVLDACRDNPFQPPNPVRYRSFANLGLAEIKKAPRGTLIAYSTAPGQQAADGKEANSVYTAALAKVILEPGLEIRKVFDKVGNLVRKRTLDDQIPWYAGSLADEYYFKPPEGVTVVAGKSLLLADAGQRSTTARRGMEAEPVQWFHNLTNPEWSQLDWEIQQRALRLTADEIPLLEHKAEGGNLLAQTTLGIVYLEGVDKAVDATGKIVRYNASNVKARKWLRQAADAGFPVAQVVLGEMYYQAQDEEGSLAEARHWLEQAARVDYTRARLDLMQLKGETGSDAVSMADVVNEVKKGFPSNQRGR